MKAKKSRTSTSKCTSNYSPCMSFLSGSSTCMRIKLTIIDRQETGCFAEELGKSWENVECVDNLCRYSLLLDCFWRYDRLVQAWCVQAGKPRFGWGDSAPHHHNAARAVKVTVCQSVLLCQEQGAAQPGILHLRSVLNHLQRGEYQLSSEHRHDISSHHRSVVTHHGGATTLLSDMQAMFDNVFCNDLL